MVPPAVIDKSHHRPAEEGRGLLPPVSLRQGQVAAQSALCRGLRGIQHAAAIDRWKYLVRRSEAREKCIGQKKALPVHSRIEAETAAAAEKK